MPSRTTRRIISHARRMRRHPTRAERFFWDRVRNGQLDGLKVRRQHPVGPYIADFAIPRFMVLIEIDGGGHDSTRDPERTAALATKGWRILRFSDEDIFNDWQGIAEAILATVRTG